MYKILFVEDDDSLGFVIKDNLEQAGHQVQHCANGKLGLEAFKNGPFDIGVLDVMLPEMDGFTLSENIKKMNSDFPIIFLTAKSLNEDRIKGLKLGADDYISKPFNMEELLLRIEAILKRVGKSNGANNSTCPIGQYTFDLKNLKLIFNQKEQNLTHREAQLLKLLVDHKNETISREMILVALWGDNDYFKGRSMDVFITRLRKYLSEDNTLKINNVHGVGFRLEINKSE
jgi:DNA-binding response OmpR family regulator